MEGKLKKPAPDKGDAGLRVLFIMLNYAASCPLSSRDPETLAATSEDPQIPPQTHLEQRRKL